MYNKQSNSSLSFVPGAQVVVVLVVDYTLDNDSPWNLCVCVCVDDAVRWTTTPVPGVTLRSSSSLDIVQTAQSADTHTDSGLSFVPRFIITGAGYKRHRSIHTQDRVLHRME